MSAQRTSLLLAAVAALVVGGPVRAQTAAEIDAVTAQWIDAFNRKSAADIAKLYAPDAVFFGTSSPVLRDTPKLVAEYFAGLAALGDARNALGEHRVQVLGDVAISSGFYTLTRVQDGKTTQSPARFTFVYQKRAGKWLIVSHHSSALPATAN